MLIHEVVKHTGLSRKAIYFYIRKNLVSPETNEQNGYKIYSQHDLERLMVISRLRALDISIQDIKIILDDSGKLEMILQRNKIIQHRKLCEAETRYDILTELIKNCKVV